MPKSHQEHRVFPKLFQGLCSNTFLQNLDMSNAGLPSRALQDLADVLVVNKSLKYLDISGNHLDHVGHHLGVGVVGSHSAAQDAHRTNWQEFVASLSRNSCLQVLILAWEDQKLRVPKAAQHTLAEAMKYNSTLLKLRIPLTEAKCKEVVDSSLRRNSQLWMRRKAEALQRETEALAAVVRGKKAGPLQGSFVRWA